VVRSRRIHIPTHQADRGVRVGVYGKCVLQIVHVTETQSFVSGVQPKNYAVFTLNGNSNFPSTCSSCSPLHSTLTSGVFFCISYSSALVCVSCSLSLCNLPVFVVKMSKPRAGHLKAQRASAVRRLNGARRQVAR